MQFKRFTVKVWSVADIYDEALKKLRADKRTPAAIGELTGVPPTTIRDIKERICTNPRIKTVKKIVAHYFPEAA